jgi:tRNA nucleotidyltransferase (CCA-adding enzyme)
MYLAALVASLTQEERMEALKRLSASERLAGEVGTLLQRARVALRELPLGDAARIHGALAALPIEALLLAMAFTKHEDRKKEVSRYLLEIRKVRTILTGADLMAMGFAPGPQYGAILAALLGAKIRGNLPRREDEERFVREWAGA